MDYFKMIDFPRKLILKKSKSLCPKSMGVQIGAPPKQSKYLRGKFENYSSKYLFEKIL